MHSWKQTLPLLADKCIKMTLFSQSICLTLVKLIEDRNIPLQLCLPAIPWERVFLVASLVLSPSCTALKESL
jgi:hypothetical protein